MAELVQIPFRAGLDEGTDPKQLPPGTLKVAKNVRQDKNGRIIKRHGTTLLAATAVSGSSVSDAYRLIPRGDSLGLADSTEAIVYTEALSKWQRMDRVPVLTSTSRPFAGTTRSTSQATQAAYGDLMIQVYSTATAGVASVPGTGILYVQVEDSARGIMVMRPTLVDSSSKLPRVFVDGTTAYILYVTSAGTLTRKALDLTTMTLGSAASVTTNVVVWDGVIKSGVAYLAIGKAAGLTAERWTLATPTQLHTATVAGAATYSAVGIDAYVGGNCLVIYSTSAPTTRVATLLASDLTGLVGPTQIVAAQSYAASVLRLDATSMLIAYSPLSANLAIYTTTASVNQSTHAIATNSARTTYHQALASHIFAVGSRYYFMATVAIVPPAIATTNDVAISPMSAVVTELEYSNSIVMTPHRRAGSLESRTSSLGFAWVTQPATDSGGRVHLAALRKQREPVGTEAPPTSVVNHAIDEAAEDWGRPLGVGPNTLVPASAPFMFDGVAAYPYGFVHEPVILTASDLGAGAGSMAAGDYVYACVYEWRDANGILHRSAPSPQVRVTVAAGTSAVRLRIANTGTDAKQSPNSGTGSTSTSPVRIAIYRTEADGTVLYRLTHEPDYNVVLNDPTSERVQFDDDKADSSIAGSGPVVALSTRPQLYTSQELEEFNPGAAVTGIVHRGRAWLLSGDRRTIQATKKFEEDPELAPGCNEVLTLLFDRDKYAFGGLDDKLVVMDEEGIDIVVGDGPDSAGNASDWQIVRVQSDIGCANPKSVVTCPRGVAFVSSRGFELLDRGLSVLYIGATVEDTLADYPNVTSAVLVPEEEEVRWSCNNDAGTAGVVIAWNYRINAWYTRTYFDIYGMTNGIPITDAALIEGVYTILIGGGRVLRETTASSLDVRSTDIFVPMDVQVPIYPAGAVGWHRLKDVQLVGESLSNHKLTIEVSRDFSASFEQTKTWEAGSDVTTVGPLEQARMTLRIQKRQAAVVRIYDASPANTTTHPLGTGQGPALELLAVHVSRKEGPAKLPAGNRS